MPGGLTHSAQRSSNKNGRPHCMTALRAEATRQLCGFLAIAVIRFRH